MRLSTFTDTDWLYPDSEHSSQTAIILDAVCGGHAGAQILGDTLPSEATVQFRWNDSDGPDVQLFQLLPVGVNENTSPTLMTTTDYESCRAFVTRKAPFDVYDALRPVDGTIPADGRLALYLCIDVPQQAEARVYNGVLAVNIDADEYAIPVTCTVHGLSVPK